MTAKVTPIGQAPSVQQTEALNIAVDELVELGLLAWKGDGTDNVYVTNRAVRLMPYLTVFIEQMVERTLQGAGKPNAFDDEAWSVVISDLHWVLGVVTGMATK